MNDHLKPYSRRYYNKLIRDKIPEIIAAGGSKYELIVLSESEFLRALKDKLVEESKEVQTATGLEMIKELADVYEVMETLISKYNLAIEEIKKEQEKRRRERGGFEQKLYLLWTEKSSQ